MIGIYGGTFDPIHFGHLRSALEVAEQLALSKVLMIPSAQPPHRQTPQVSAQHRWKMLQLALSGQSRLIADDCEIMRHGRPSYTYDTLVALRREFADTPLCLIQGSDVFADLAAWHRWQELLDLAHIVVMHRASGYVLPLKGGQNRASGYSVQWNDKVKQHYGAAMVNDVSQLSSAPAGLICELDVTLLHISATDIRQRLLKNKAVRYLIPDSVLAYIKQNQLYQRTLGVQHG